MNTVQHSKVINLKIYDKLHCQYFQTNNVVHLFIFPYRIINNIARLQVKIIRRMDRGAHY